MNVELSETIVLDIGGTYMRGGSLDDQSEPSVVFKAPEDRDLILPEIFRLIESVCVRGNLRATNIVVGCPGLISLSGQIDAALYWPAQGIDLPREIGGKFGARVSVLNDANLQAQSIARRLQNAIYLTFGTGVGGAIVLSEDVFLGINGYAGEFGHVSINGQNAPCKCGRIGCLDTVASGYWLSRKLGCNWWEQPAEKLVQNALVEAGAAAAEVVAATVTTLDIKNVELAGHLITHSQFIATFEQTLRNAGISVSLEYHPDSWPLAVEGATHWLEKKGELL